MELRKDPITRSWVITGDDVPEAEPRPGGCRFCPGVQDSPHVLWSMPSINGGPWSSRAVVHPMPLYHVEGEPGRRGDGLYDCMLPVGAHEVLVENPRHDGHLWNASDVEIEQFLTLTAQRIQDLKRDSRFKYISVFKNHGRDAGQEFPHATSQLTATTFIPRRVLYELRAGRDYFAAKERCVFCDILSQELKQGGRVIELRGDYVSLCPYASRAPYETWVLSRNHDTAYEHAALARGANLRDLAALLSRTLKRIRTITEEFHLVLHSSPNTRYQSETLGYWKTIDEDYHWHIEILPILGPRARSYTFKEVYYSPVSSETAARRLRDAAVD